MSQNNSPPPSAIQRVPVFQTMREAYRAVFKSLPHLIQAAALPFMLSLVILGLSLLVGGNVFLSLILTVFSFVPYTLFGVAWHRLTLLGPTYGAPQVFPSWQRRHWQFLSYVIAITTLAWVLVLLVGALIGGAGSGFDQSSPLAAVLTSWFVLAAVLYAVLRFSFVFPAAAVDEAYGLRDSWSHTRGQVMRLFAILLVTALPVMFLLLIVVNVFHGSFFADVTETYIQTGSAEVDLQRLVRENMGTVISLQILQSVFGYIVLALSVSAISIAFRTCTGWVPAAQSGPPAVGTNDGGADEDGAEDGDGDARP